MLTTLLVCSLLHFFNFKTRKKETELFDVISILIEFVYKLLQPFYQSNKSFFAHIDYPGFVRFAQSIFAFFPILFFKTVNGIKEPALI